MDSEPRDPSRLPVRGTLGLVGTICALALLLSFRGAPASISEAVSADDDDAEATEELISGPLTETSAVGALAEPVLLTGDLIETRWGDVQVAVTVDGDDITDVEVLVLPDGDDHSVEISDYVGPILRNEAVASDSAAVSVITGATYTSEAYARSLQSALDQLSDPEAARIETVPEAPEQPDASTKAAAASGPVTLTGDAIGIRWGDVQVAVTVDDGDIIDVETLAIPLGDRRSQRINQQAEPLLREEAIARDSAAISVVSGATYTSRAYAASLQSALDQLDA